MNDLDLDAIEARYKETIADSPRDLWIPENVIKGDITALIAEVRRLRAIRDLAIRQIVQMGIESGSDTHYSIQSVTKNLNYRIANK